NRRDRGTREDAGGGIRRAALGGAHVGGRAGIRVRATRVVQGAPDRPPGRRSPAHAQRQGAAQGTPPPAVTRAAPGVTRDRGTLAGGRQALLVIVALMGSAVAAYPILGNYFTRDDFGSFYEVANFGPWGFILEAASGHMYLLRNTVLYI